MKKIVPLTLGFSLAVLLCGCSKAAPKVQYNLADVHPVSGRQGVCIEGDHYWVSGSGSLEKYDSEWNLLAEKSYCHTNSTGIGVCTVIHWPCSFKRLHQRKI